ncbi:MAG: 16S rRNA (guanine(966)-N(2))-methyltransferase RsmD [Methylobacteriaceae bacterium]|jgi:16S rRNA (guanine966-N2)-methyltransferase|nr:16S rRNA (guanine(966)-N(2))-methyltransferase RsmD [Methylobacteriaceae bacterium]
MRIVGGRLRGRALSSPHSNTVRPTADRLREALFNILEHRYDNPVAGARVLDLFAGTGALGLEALSRGAEFVAFVDTGAEARGLIRENIEELGFGGAARVFRRDATKMGEAHPNAPFTLVFSDPPYGFDLTPKALISCRDGGWLAPDALLVLEERAGDTPLLPAAGFTLLEQREYGDTRLVFARAGG